MEKELSISVKDVFEVFDKWHSEYDSNTNYIEWLHKFKPMIELKLKEIGK